MDRSSASICVFVSTLFVSTNVFAGEPAIAPTPSAAPTTSVNAPAADVPPPVDVLPEPPPPPPAPVEQPATRPLSKPLPPEAPFGPSMWGPGVGRPPITVPITRSYGWQTFTVLIATDVITIASVFGGIDGLSTYSLYSIVPTHLLAGPVVHLAHRRVKTAFLSLGINTVAPVVSYWTGLLAGGYVGAAILTPIALISAHVIDIGILSRETINVPYSPPHGTRALLPSSVSVVPRIDAQFQGFAIVGQF